MSIEKIAFNNHDEWLDIRSKYIGGSDAGAVMGMNPYSSPYRVWAEKTGKIPSFEGSVITRVGAELEDLVARMFCEEKHKKVQRCNFTLVNSDYPFACANVDRMLVGEDAILECKTTNSFVNVKKFAKGEFPEQWYCQCMHYLAVTGKKKAYLACLSECRDFHIFEMDRDEAEIKALMEAEAEFWNKYVIPKRQPPADGSAATTEAIGMVHKDAMDMSIDLFGMDGQLDVYRKLCDQEKDIKKMKDEISNNIKEMMGAASKAKTARYSISWSSSGRASFDKKQFQKDNPSIDLSRWEKVTETRTFRITERKDQDLF